MKTHTLGSYDQKQIVKALDYLAKVYEDTARDMRALARLIESARGLEVRTND